jgi:hypothetical protein
LWLVIVLAIKIGFYRRGVVIGDLFLYANAFANTHLAGPLLYVADYQLLHGSKTLALDHVEPSTVLLVPLFWLFETPLCLVVLQALAPAVLAGALVVTARRLAGAAWLGWAVAVATLYNPLFFAAVIDGVFGFHHDAQYLIYTPLFLATFLLRRFGWTMLFLILFLGVKEDAAFFGIAFGTTLALFDLPGGGALRDYRCAGLAVAAVSAAYFIATVVVLPHLIASPNIYAASGVAELHQGLGHAAASAWHNFFARKWHNFWLYFWLAFGSPTFVVAGLPDLAMFSVMARDANHYFDFTIVIFLAFGLLLTLIRLRGSAPGTPARRWRPALAAAFAVQLLLCVPFGLADLRHAWARAVPLAPPPPAADAEAGWNMVDPNCSVTVSDGLLPRFYEARYWLQWPRVASARFVVTATGEAQADPVADFVAAHAARLDLVGRSGPVAVWRNPGVPCLPW